MERRLMITEDGSHTVFVEGLEEPYHSTHGALQESMHVFIRQGFFRVQWTSVRILELGFGTGLNALLTLVKGISSNKDIYYHSVEKYPLLEHEYNMLNYEKFLDREVEGTLQKLHNCPWGEAIKISDRFTLFKEESDFRTMNIPPDINLIYLDAFSPDKQAELWTQKVIGSIAEQSVPGAVLVTYSSKGLVRRTLTSCGFHVEKVEGPPGKREMVRATKR